MSDVCGVTCPGSSRTCERPPHDPTAEHRTTLTPGHTYLRWREPSTTVTYRTGTVEDAEQLLGDGP